MTTYEITMGYEPENGLIRFEIQGLREMFNEPGNTSFSITPYDHKMRRELQKRLKTTKHPEIVSQNIAYMLKMIDKAHGPVYVGHDDKPYLTRPYAVYACLYDITQSHDYIEDGDKFRFNDPLDGVYEFELKGAWLEHSPGAINATEEEKWEGEDRGFKNSEEVAKAIWDWDLRENPGSFTAKRAKDYKDSYNYDVFDSEGDKVTQIYRDPEGGWYEVGEEHFSKMWRGDSMKEALAALERRYE